jgi:sulfide dehydrogenase [flavocytochrome c] flavoprotein chain
MVIDCHPHSNTPINQEHAVSLHSTPFSRRQVLQSTTLGLTVLASGCASLSSSAQARVVVVGGGWGGLGAVRGLIGDSRRVEVTLIEANEGFMSCPLSAHYIVGLQPASDFQRSYTKLDELGVRRVRERVLEIDRTKSQVVTATQRIGYDFLVLSPGIDYMEESIAGFAEARQHLPVGFRAFEQAAVKREVDVFLAQGGTFVISAPKPPYRCPPAPYERAFLIAEQMKKRGTKGKIILLDANAGPTPPPIAQPILNAMKSVYGAQIEYLPNTDIKAVDIGKRRLQTSEGDIDFAHANLILPMRANALVRQAGLGERWAAVKLPRFISQADEKIYVIGDAQGTPLPKSGHVAFNTGKQVAEEILERVAGHTIVAPTGRVELPLGICWANVTHDTAININVASGMEPGKAPVLKFSVDPEHNARSGAAALSWGTGMWKAMLG